MSASKQTPAVKPAIPTTALFIELEAVLLNGHGVLFEALGAALKAEGVGLSSMLFIKYALGRSVNTAVASLARHLALGEDASTRVTEAAWKHVLSAFGKAAAPRFKNFPALVEKVRAQGGVVACLSQLPQESAERLVAGLGCGALAVAGRGEGRHEGAFPTGGDWLNLARSLGMRPGACVAVFAGGAGMRAAMAARVRGVAIPDRFSTFQDFGGADYVLESLDAAAILGLLQGLSKPPLKR